MRVKTSRDDLREMEARDGIEPPNKALQTLPFSFWVPRPLTKVNRGANRLVWLSISLH